MESTLKIKCTSAEIRAEFDANGAIRYFAPANEERTEFKVIVRHPETPDGKELNCRTLSTLRKRLAALV